jgi:hypothetical protein
LHQNERGETLQIVDRCGIDFDADSSRAVLDPPPLRFIKQSKCRGLALSGHLPQRLVRRAHHRAPPIGTTLSLIAFGGVQQNRDQSAISFARFAIMGPRR